MRGPRLASIIWLLVACKDDPRDRCVSSTPTTVSTAPSASASILAAAAPPSASAALEAPPPPSSPTGAPAFVDASAGRCRVLRGPIELPLRAPTAIAIRGDVVDVVLNQNGHPHIVSLAASPVPLAPVPAGREPSEGDRGTGLAIPCAVAAQHIFCPDKSGAIYRSKRAGGEDHVVASSRASSRIAAVTVGSGHVALAYLASRQTSEGWVSEAWLAVDEDPPLRISEDGSGATAVALATRGAASLALMIDARTALTAMHARSIAYDKAVRLGEDSVVFVGGPGDRRTRAALAAPAEGPAWSFLPIAKDVGSFGLAIVRIDEPPRVDEPVVWSMYPNGLDPAPVAAASGERGSVVWVARVRPRGAEPSAPRLLELGRIAPKGAFTAHEVLPTTGNPSDVALAVDSFGALWLAWVDVGGSWLERLLCR